MLTLTVPGLLARGTHALGATAPFQSFARYADPPELNGEGLASALCAALGLPPTTPLAPLCALGAGLDVDDRYLIAATPVTLSATLNGATASLQLNVLPPSLQSVSVSPSLRTPSVQLGA